MSPKLACATKAVKAGEASIEMSGLVGSGGSLCTLGTLVLAGRHTGHRQGIIEMGPVTFLLLFV